MGALAWGLDMANFEVMPGLRDWMSADAELGMQLPWRPQHAAHACGQPDGCPGLGTGHGQLQGSANFEAVSDLKHPVQVPAADI